MAMLTGTDIVDHLRTVEFVINENGDLTPSSQTLTSLGSEIESMFTEIENAATENTQDDLQISAPAPSIFEV